MMTETTNNLFSAPTCGLILLYAFLGGALKTIDNLTLNLKPNQVIAVSLAIFSGFLMSYLMLTDMVSASIFSAIILASFIAKKIDNFPFMMGAALVFSTIAFTGVFNLSWTLFTPLLAFAYFDEISSDFGDRNKGLLASILRYRIIMKIGVIGLGALTLLPLTHVIAFFAFDITYQVMT